MVVGACFRLKYWKRNAPGEDRTHDLQIALWQWLWDWRATYCATEAYVKEELKVIYNLLFRNWPIRNTFGIYCDEIASSDHVMFVAVGHLDVYINYSVK